MRVGRLVVLMSLVTASGAWAQGTAEQMADGDRRFAARDATGALRAYDAVLSVDPKNYEALCKASRSAIDLGEFDPREEVRTDYYTRAREYASRAIAVNPRDAEGHFAMGRATGRAALTVPSRQRINYGKIVRSETLLALAANPRHAGALHVLGVWNAEVMRLPAILRFIARQFLGGEVFGEASWEAAQRNLELAVAVEPGRIVHHLDLGKILAERGDRLGARAQFDWIAQAPVTDYNDGHYKESAANERRTL